MNNTLLEPSEISRRIIDILTDRQAEDIVQLDVSQVASFTDYFVIATAQNGRHMGALLNAFDRDLANQGVKSLRTEGDANSGWVLV
ncbi:MAG: ribosome silencing factor, partial [Dehalococcoidia bacterium]